MTYEMKNKFVHTKNKKHLYIGLSLNNRQINRSVDEATMDTYSSTIEEQIELAKKAEKAKLDFVFKPDSLFAHPEMLLRSKGSSSLDPTLLLTIIAQHTKKIGLVTTALTSYNPPYILARQLQSLHWISNGRAGWNIVTSIDGSENFGNEDKPSSEERYAKAAECTEVVRKLWGSYPYNALQMENKNMEVAIRDLVQPIHHEGAFFQVKGPLNIAAHPSGELPLFQAGASDPGRHFAASVADAIFAATPDMEAAMELRQNIKKRTQQHGRQPEEIRILPGLYFFIGDSYEEAQAMHQQAHEHLTLEHKYASVERIIGSNLRKFSLKEKITERSLPIGNQPVRSRTHADLLHRYIIQNEPTVEELLSRPEVIDSAHWVVVGTAKQVFREIMKWYQQGAIDGFIAIPGGTSKSLDLFFNQVIPLLVEEGVFRKEYTGSTLREHLQISR
ncbi:MAG: NtaA/DmoA family FMN-dependent monooxygenase [Bacillaceae bacterium]